jgi:hypothetical protein
MGFDLGMTAYLRRDSYLRDGSPFERREESDYALASGAARVLNAFRVVPACPEYPIRRGLGGSAFQLRGITARRPGRSCSG